MPLHGFPLPLGAFDFMIGLPQRREAIASAESSHVEQGLFGPHSDSDNQDIYETRHWRYILAHFSLMCPDTPWHWNISPDGSTVIPRFVEGRLSKQSYASWDVKAEERRTINWGVVAMAARETAPDEYLFTSSGASRVFTLRSPFPTAVPFQRVHFGPWAIPDELADIKCVDMSLQDMLNQLNSILDTTYTLDDTTGLATCLRDVAAKCHDFGELYGHIRPWWRWDFTSLPNELDAIRASDEDLRNSAIVEDRIVNPDIPPRRVWDLYSNRVIPFHAIPPVSRFRLDRSSPPPTRVNIPANVWAVSHGWLNEEDRQVVWTPINGKQWPVPIPRQITLAHVRIELLNLGAEWIWLDVLCLRQWGRDEDEPQRKEEWKLDVPTIGHVYQHNDQQTCVTYFNGLGIPFDDSPETIWHNNRHWFRRAWTLQETCVGWILGGLTGAEIADGPRIFGILRDMVQHIHRDQLFHLVDNIRTRYSSTSVDKIAGLGYLLQCPTLPVYNEDTTTERAWELLVRHLHPRVRTDLLIRFPEPGPSGWCPSWEQITRKTFWELRRIPYFDREECLKFDARYDAYYHSARRFVEDCHVERVQGESSAQDATYKTQFPHRDSDDDRTWYFRLRPGHMPIVEDEPYTLVNIGNMFHWLIGKRVRTRKLGEESAIMLKKVGIFSFEGSTAIDELKRSTLGDDSEVFTYL